MPQIDPVILKLIADNQKYERDLRSTTTKVDQLLGTQEKRAKRLENEMRKSSSSISGSIRSIAASFAGYFTGRELVGLLDSFTRLQNNLRVAGVAGDQMKAVQDRLFASAQKYGVELESLSSLFSTLTQVSKELGASQQQIFSITDAVSASLKITGISAQEASGALLQFGQALRSGKVQAEEYNSLLDGLYPLLEAAAVGSERWGGSVAKLTADVKAGKVTSQEFFQAILAGSTALETKAAKATLTLSSGFTTLTNALTVYFGEADKAQGVSAALGEALGVLADNLETLIPALAAVATALGVGYVVNATRARVATLALGAAQVGAAGAAGTMGFAVGRLGSALLALVGGGYGAAILAIGAALAYVATRSQTAADAEVQYQAALSKANGARDSAIGLARQLATATGEARKATELKIAATLKSARADQIAALAALKRAQAELALAQATSARLNADAAKTPGRGSAEIGFVQGEANRNLRLKTGELRGADDVLKVLNETVKALRAPLSVPALPSLGGGAPAGGGKGKKGSAGSGGPSAADIAHRFDAERAQIMEQYNNALGSMAKSAEEQAEFELRNVELARIRTQADIKANDDYSAAQKRQLSEMVEHLAEVERERVERDKRVRLEQEQADLLQAEGEIRHDELDAARDAAVTAADRREIGAAIIDLEYEIKRQLLEQVLASKDATDAMRRRAQLELDNLPGAQQRAQNRNTRENGGPLDEYLRRTDPAKNGERAEQLVVDELDHIHQSISHAISDAIGVGDDPLISGLIDLLLEQILFRPLAEALSQGANGLSGGGGLLGGLLSGIGSIFGFASGGYTPGGRMIRVNEGASPGRVEGFIPQGAGNIIPLGRMNALAAGGAQQAGIATVRVELGGDIDARIQRVSGPVAVEVVRGAAPTLIDAGAREAIARSNRPRI